MRLLIIAISIIAMGVTAATVLIGEKSFDGLVVDKPYETGLSWDTAQQQKEALGWRVEITGSSFSVGENDLPINVFDRSGNRLSAAEVTVKITRPETTAYDKTYAAIREAGGSYHASVMLPVTGNWQAVVAVSLADNRAMYVIPLYASGGAHAGHH